jgi:hypothetical protein
MHIKKKFITFVLGAGSSFEVKMPTGNDLKTKIASCLSFKIDDFGRVVGGDNQIRSAIHHLTERPGGNGTTNDYYNAAHRICVGMPQAISIDNFIDNHRANNKIAEIGKIAIATEILRAEKQSSLYVSPKNINNKLDFSLVSNTWFNAFFQLLHLNTQEENLAERLERVKVITFNYDRTLEHFLFHSIQNYYGSTPQRAAEILSHLTILHPYGQVGKLPWQTESDTVPFGFDIDAPRLIQASNNLRTFTEGTSHQESDIEHIRATILEAEIVAFLGFAYHELNLELLFGPPKHMPADLSRQVFGTAMGLSESDKRAIANSLAIRGGFDSSQITLRRELSAGQLLPEYSRTLRIPSSSQPASDSFGS